MQPELTHRQTVTIIAGLMLGMILAALDQTIVSTALPRITGDLGGLDHISWVVSAYLMATTVAMPVYGRLGDQFGRKHLFQVGIVVFLVGSLLAGMAQSMLQLIARRALQGLGAGGLIVLATAIIGEVVAPRERGRYQGYVAAGFAFSSIAGPLLGGFITDHLSWRWVFYVNAPLALAAFVVTGIVVPDGVRRARTKVDVLGAVLLACSVSLLVLITTWGGVEYPWSSSLMLGLIALELALVTVLVLVERRADQPMVPLHLLRLRPIAVTTAICFVLGLSLFGSVAFLPLYLQVVTGASATSSGVALMPMMGGLLVSSIVSGRLISRTGRYKVFPLVGTAMASTGLFLMGTISAGTGRPTIGVFVFVFGCGIGLTMPVLFLVAQNAAPLHELGSATGSTVFFREVGGSVGIAVFGAVFASGLHRRLGGIRLARSALSVEAIRAMPAEQAMIVVHAVAGAVAHVFVFTGPIMFIAFLGVWLLREVPLRSTVVTEHVMEDDDDLVDLPTGELALESA